MIDPAPATIDRFWHLTSAVWTAIGSFVGAASVIALVVFNWRYLHWTRKLSDAAATQAEVTRESLDALKRQIADEEDHNRHAALAALGEAIDVLHLWSRQSKNEYRTNGNRITLIPENWSVLISFLARRYPGMATQAYSAAREIREIEVELNQWVTVPFTGRGPNSSTSRLHANMLLRFERAFNTLNNISMDLKP